MSTAEETPEGFYLGEDGEWVPNGWSMDKISSVFPYVVDNRGKTPPIDRDGGFELIEVNAISKHSRKPVYSAVIKFLSEETFRNWFRKGTLQTGDILMPTVGTIGEASICLDNRGAIAQNLVGLRCCERNIPMYWYYWFCSPHSKKLILNLDIGGVQPSVKVPHLLEQKVKFPAKSEQKAIAAVLGSLDDKIELLREQNETLEALAQTLFKRWFIDFNFPDENGNPYKDSGGKMVASELGEIPEGWTLGALSETVILNDQSWSAKRHPAKIEYVDLANTKNGIIQKTETYDFHEAPSRARRILSKFDVIIGTVRPGNKSYALIGADKQLTGSTGFAVCSPTRPEHKEFNYLALTRNEAFNRLEFLADGSAYPAVNPDVVISELRAIANSEGFKTFSAATFPLLSKVLSNQSQIQTLTHLRNTLLPKLMKGEIRVPVKS